MSRSAKIIAGIFAGLGLIYYGVVTPILKAIEISEASDKVGGWTSMLFSHFTPEGLFLARLGGAILIATLSIVWLPALIDWLGYGDGDFLEVARPRTALVHLRDRPIASETELLVWEKEIDSLREQIADVLGQRSSARAELFRIVGNPPAVAGG